MKLLYTKNLDEFRQCTSIYDKELLPTVEIMQKEAKCKSSLGKLKIYQDYSVYVRWPIRKLEYSFMLLNTLDALKPNSKLLDVGCGVTPIPNYYSKKGAQVYAIDADDEVINYLRNDSNRLYNSGVNFMVMDLSTGIDFPDRTFDIITCISVLEHLKLGDDAFAIKEMQRVLKDDRKIIFTVDFIPEKPFIKFLVLLKKTIKLFWFKGDKKIGEKITDWIMHFNRLFFAKKYSNKAYNLRIVSKTFGIDSSLFKKENYRAINPLEIKEFWRRHWFPGCLYDKNEGRNYVSIGFVLGKDCFFAPCWSI